MIGLVVALLFYAIYWILRFLLGVTNLLSSYEASAGKKLRVFVLVFLMLGVQSFIGFLSNPLISWMPEIFANWVAPGMGLALGVTAVIGALSKSDSGPAIGEDRSKNFKVMERQLIATPICVAIAVYVTFVVLTEYFQVIVSYVLREVFGSMPGVGPLGPWSVAFAKWEIFIFQSSPVIVATVIGGFVLSFLCGFGSMLISAAYIFKFVKEVSMPSETWALTLYINPKDRTMRKRRHAISPKDQIEALEKDLRDKEIWYGISFQKRRGDNEIKYITKGWKSEDQAKKIGIGLKSWVGCHFEVNRAWRNGLIHTLKKRLSQKKRNNIEDAEPSEI